MATKKAASQGANKGETAERSRAAKKIDASRNGGASKKLGANERIIHVPASQGKCTDWQAVQDSRPPLVPRLRVTGRCTFPTPGYKVTLKESVPQGTNPRILLLTKTVKPPRGIQPQVLQTILVGYEKKNATTTYDSVTILPEVKTIKVKQVT
ncbi:MAG TPA: hypothetical protein VGB76_08320 [Pyrinomonadaceae bacterium]|jgi:hypothetical protein